MNPGNITNLENLRLAQPIRADLEDFLSQIISFYQTDLLSIMAFGSCVTGDFCERSSDINLLVIYSDLNMVSLNKVAELAQKWLAKRDFAPRFLSRRNLVNSARYFPLDMLEMKDAHRVLYGADLLAEIPVSARDLHWQLAHEIKAMRMRIKQQFWRTSGDEFRMRRVLLERFTSLVHLTRAVLFLLKLAPPVDHRGIMKLAVTHLKINPAYVDNLFQLKNMQLQASRENMLQFFTDTMETIRIVDTQVDALAEANAA